MFSSLRDIVYLAALAHLPRPIFKGIVALMSYFMLGDLQKDKDFSAKRVAKRLEQGTNRNDFVSPILRCVTGMLAPTLSWRWKANRIQSQRRKRHDSPRDRVIIQHHHRSRYAFPFLFP